ncbi:MAG: hypothetical protein IT479_04680 [Xanthomonadales bacterium]|nr:hypothetical protein [Xanthomonadales bacterium]
MSKRRLQLILIALAFLVPALLATLLQTRWMHWDPASTRNRGELIRPVIGLVARSDAGIADGRRWSVVVRVPAACDAGCERRLALLGRVREAQGKEMERVRMLAWPAAGRAPQTPWTAWQPDARQQGLLALAEAEVVLVDPLGNAMMRYRADADPSDVRKDVAHLLRWSKVGQ